MQRNKQPVDQPATDANKPADGMSTPDGKQTPSNQSTPQQAPEKNERLGNFSNLSQFMKLYEILKGAYKNYQTSTVLHTMEKFNGFVHSILQAFSLLLELTTFNELGSHAEEFLDYLKATARIEEELTFLAVQQVCTLFLNLNLLNAYSEKVNQLFSDQTFL